MYGLLLTRCDIYIYTHNHILEKIQLEFNFAQLVPSNLRFSIFVLSELIQCKKR